MESSSASTNSNWTTLVLVVLGVSSVVLYRFCLRAEAASDITWFLQLVAGQAILYLVAAWVILRSRPNRSVLLIVIVFTALFRLSILFAPPFLSDDIYRYVWDGRVQAAGANPYRYVPADPALAQLRDEAIYPEINRRDYAHTIYPPVAQAIFFLTTRISESITWMKVTMLGFEAIGIWAIIQLLTAFGLSRQRVLLYAWHPLIVWEFAGSGHLDAVTVALVMLALLARQRNSEVVVGIALAGATLVKLFPLVLFPALYKRWGWRMPLAFAATIIIAYVPYLNVGPMAVLGFLPGYVTEQGLASGEQFYLLSLTRKLISIPNAAFLIFSVLVMIGLAAWSVFKVEHGALCYIKRATVLATVAMVLFAPHYSWYFAWLVPFLCFVPVASLFYLTCASFVLYATWLGDDADQMFLINSAIYLPFVLLVVIEQFLRRGQFPPPRDKVTFD